MATISFEELKTKYQNKLAKETEVTCKLITKIKDGYLVDLNDEWEGFVPNNHIGTVIESESTSNEPFQALVISGPDKSDRYMVSCKALKEKGVWEKLSRLKEENSTLKVMISKAIKGGAEVYIEGLRAFLPGRYIRLPGLSQDHWANQEIDVLIEELDYNEKKIILNHKRAIEFEREKKAEVTIHKLKEGDIVEAPILRIAEFGVFVDLGGLDGLIPASELSWGRFNHPREIVKVGHTLRARIFRIEKENLRVALSVKQLEGDPWDGLDSDFEIGKEVSGKVIGQANFGLFVELKPGVEALLHNSEILEAAEKPKVGSLVKAKIIKMDLEERKIGLSIRDQKTEALEQVSNEENKTENPEQEKDQSHYDDLSLETKEVRLDNLPLCNLEVETEESRS